LPHERIGHDLEDKGCERLVVFGPAGDDRFIARIDSFHGGHVGRRGEVIDDGVEERLDSLVAESSSAQDGHDPKAYRRFPDRLLQRRLLDLAACQILLEQGVVDVGKRLQKPLPSG